MGKAKCHLCKGDHRASECPLTIEKDKPNPYEIVKKVDIETLMACNTQLKAETEKQVLLIRTLEAQLANAFAAGYRAGYDYTVEAIGCIPAPQDSDVKRAQVKWEERHKGLAGQGQEGENDGNTRTMLRM